MKIKQIIENNTKGLIRFIFNNKIIWLIIVGFVVHGFIILMDGLYSDDFTLWSHFQNNDWHDLFMWFKEKGDMFGISAYIHWGIKLLFLNSYIFGYRIITFTFILINSILIYKLLNAMKIFEDDMNIVIAMIFLVYPANEMNFWAILLPGSLYLFAFILACILTVNIFKGKYINSFILNNIIRIITLLLFTISFNINSLLVFYYGYFVLIYIILIKDKSEYFKHGKIIKYLDYIALPIIYYIIKIIYFPTQGLSKGYNQIVINGLGSIIRCIFCFVSGIYYSFRPILNLIKEPIFIVILILYISYLTWEIIRNRNINKKAFRAYSFILYGLMLLAMAIFPYAAVGKYPGAGTSSRHLFLINLPMGIIIVSIIEVSFLLAQSLSKNIKYYIYCLLIIMFIISNVQNYAEWQFRWIKTRAIMSQLKDMNYAKIYSTFIVEDNTYSDEKYFKYRYNFKEWAAIFKMIWNGEKWLGWDIRDMDPRKNKRSEKQFIDRFNLKYYDPKGPQAELVITYPKYRRYYMGNTTFWKYVMIGKYYYHKYYQKKGMDNYFRNVVNVHISPI